MISELQTLKNMLACVTYSGDQHTDAKIKEADPLAQLKTVNINAPNGDWFVFDPDRGRGKAALMSPLLMTGGGHQHHRACDGVIVVWKGAVLWLIFIELKSSASGGGHAGQFQSTRQFTYYLLGLLKEFHTHSFHSVEERFVRFHPSKELLNKKPTIFSCGSKPSKDPKNPQKKPVQDGVTLYLKQLLV